MAYEIIMVCFEKLKKLGGNIFWSQKFKNKCEVNLPDRQKCGN